jgi:hypothetical protein
LSEGGTGNPATAGDCAAYAKKLNITKFPVMADGSGQVAEATPMTGMAIPEVCALTPQMAVIDCWQGHKTYLEALKAIQQHAGL